LLRYSLQKNQARAMFPYQWNPTAALNVKGYGITWWSPDQYHKQTVEKRRAIHEFTLSDRHGFKNRAKL